MSYLDIYQSSLPPETTENESDASDSESTVTTIAAPVQVQLMARYRYHHLTSVLAEEIVGALSTTPAIDLSYNAIDQIPRTTSSVLIALDISYNAIERPIVLHSLYQLVELNLSNNRITDLKGLALLDTLEFLDVSSNVVVRLEGLENMKKLKVLKLQHNKIASFQSLRLLTYNSLLKDVCLDNNPIVGDPYFKVKLINYIPNLKYLDGTTVWRRTSLQSRIVNDDLKYADLCARTPASVQKYANLSKRSHHAPHGEDAMLNLSGAMLTMQGLRDHRQSAPNLSSNRALPEQTSLPRGLTHLSDVGTINKEGYLYSSPKRRHQRPAQDEKGGDIDLLPVHLQAMLHKHQRAHASPRRTAHPQATASTPSANQPVRVSAEPARTAAHVGIPSSSAVPGSGRSAAGVPVEADMHPPRPRSALPWRNPPKLTPNLDVHFKSRQRFDADSRSVASSVGDTSSVGGGGGGRANSVTRTGQRLTNVSVSATPQTQTSRGDNSFAQAQSRGQSFATPSPKYTSLVQESVSPLYPSPTRSPAKPSQPPVSTPAVASDAAPVQSQWMNPQLNSAIKTRTSAPLDSHLMENAMNSSLFILQQSFEADKRVRSDNGSVASSSIARGRPRTRQETHAGSDAGTRSQGASSTRGALRAVTPTKSSISRANYTNEMVRAQQDVEHQARVLAEARTYTRTSPSRSPQRGRNPAYTYLQGTSSPTKTSEDGIPSYSVRTQSFSPQRTKAISTSYRSRSPYRESQSGSPPKESSTARILELYRDMPAHVPSSSRNFAVDSHSPPASTDIYPDSEGYERAFAAQHVNHQQERPVRNPAAGLKIKVPAAALKHSHAQRSDPIAPDKMSSNSAASKKSKPQAQASHLSHAQSASDESKERSDQQHHVPPPPPPPSRAGDESPYNRFLRLRERLSSKYVQSKAETGEFFEPVRSASSAEDEAKESRGDHSEPSVLIQHSHSLSPPDLRAISTQASVLVAPVEPNVAPATTPQAELSFEQLKEQYQRQYQAEYDKQRQEHDSLSRAKSMSPKASFSLSEALTSTLQSALASSLNSTLNSTTGSTSSRASTPSRGAAELPPGSVVAPPTVPPRGSGYEALYDLIHQRRSVLERITQPDHLSPERGRHASPEKERIGGAISSLKQRQAASVNVIQSATRERAVPAPVHNGLLQVSLSTPALYPSISNYAFMTQANPPPAGAQGGLGTPQNSFMNRLTSNNPYMTHVEPTTTGHPNVINASRFEGVTNLAQSYPAPPPYVPRDQLLSGVPGISDNAPYVAVAAPPVSTPVVSLIGLGGRGSGDLAKAIRDLQEKQTRDLTALKTH